MNNNLQRRISEYICRKVEFVENNIEYRTPVIGFASASDPRFRKLKQLVHPDILLPQDLLPEAKTVVSFFVPFKNDLRKANRADPMKVALEWGIAYIRTNTLIRDITDGLIEMLAVLGVGAAAEPATHNFNRETLNTRWAHKSVAVIAGVGSFGMHKMIITDSGCLGRLGSLVFDAEIEPTLFEPKERCQYFHDGSCGKCAERCPVGALTVDGIDKQLCYKRCKQVADELIDIGYADVCGKCATGPCSIISPVKTEQSP